MKDPAKLRTGGAARVVGEVENAILCRTWRTPEVAGGRMRADGERYRSSWYDCNSNWWRTAKIVAEPEPTERERRDR